MKKLILLTVVILGFTVTSFAQISATASITANILSVGTIQKIYDLSFGSIYTPDASGTVTVNAQESPNRTASSGIVLGPGSGQSSKFTVSGLPGDHNLSVSNNTIVLSSGSNVMDVILSDMPGHATGTGYTTGKVTVDASGIATFYVGGTLYIAPKQPFGNYKNTTDFVVTLNY